MRSLSTVSSFLINPRLRGRNYAPVFYMRSGAYVKRGQPCPEISLRILFLAAAKCIRAVHSDAGYTSSYRANDVTRNNCILFLKIRLTKFSLITLDIFPPKYERRYFARSIKSETFNSAFELLSRDATSK